METSRIAKNVEGPKVENHRESKSKYGIETKSCGIVNLRNCNGPLCVMEVNLFPSYYGVFGRRKAFGIFWE